MPPLHFGERRFRSFMGAYAYIGLFSLRFYSLRPVCALGTSLIEGGLERAITVRLCLGNIFFCVKADAIICPLLYRFNVGTMWASSPTMALTFSFVSLLSFVTETYLLFSYI